MSRTSIVINDLPRLRRYLSRPTGEALILQLQELTPGERVRWQRRLDRLHSVCGCTAGMVAGMFGTAVWLLLVRCHVVAPTGVSRGISTVLATFVLPAVIVKVGALQLARYRLRVAGRQLLVRLEQ